MVLDGEGDGSDVTETVTEKRPRSSDSESSGELEPTLKKSCKNGYKVKISLASKLDSSSDSVDIKLALEESFEDSNNIVSDKAEEAVARTSNTRNNAETITKIEIKEEISDVNEELDAVHSEKNGKSAENILFKKEENSSDEDMPLSSLKMKKTTAVDSDTSDVNGELDAVHLEKHGKSAEDILLKKEENSSDEDMPLSSLKMKKTAAADSDTSDSGPISESVFEKNTKKAGVNKSETDSSVSECRSDSDSESGEKFARTSKKECAKASKSHPEDPSDSEARSKVKAERKVFEGKPDHPDSTSDSGPDSDSNSEPEDEKKGQQKKVKKKVEKSDKFARTSKKVPVEGTKSDLEDSTDTEAGSDERGKRKRKPDKSDSTSDSGPDSDLNSEPEENKKGKKKSPKTVEKNDKQNSKTMKKSSEEKYQIRIKHLKRMINTAGIRVRSYELLWKGCSTDKQRINKLQSLLEEEGISGRPTLEKCRALKKKKEIAEELAVLQENVILNPSGRSRRNVQHDNPQAREPPAQKMNKVFQRIKAVFDSDSE